MVGRAQMLVALLMVGFPVFARPPTESHGGLLPPLKHAIAFESITSQTKRHVSFIVRSSSYRVRLTSKEVTFSSDARLGSATCGRDSALFKGMRSSLVLQRTSCVRRSAQRFTRLRLL